MLVAMKIELESKEMQIERGDDSGGEVYSILSRFLPQIVDMKCNRKKRDNTSRGGRTHASSLHEALLSKLGIQNGPLVLFLHAEYLSKVPKHIRRNDRDREQVETLIFLFKGGSRHLRFAELGTI